MWVLGVYLKMGVQYNICYGKIVNFATQVDQGRLKPYKGINI